MNTDKIYTTRGVNNLLKKKLNYLPLYHLRAKIYSQTAISSVPNKFTHFEFKYTARVPFNVENEPGNAPGLCKHSLKLTISFFQQEGNPFHTSSLLRAFVRSFFQQEGNLFHTSPLLRAFVRSFFQQERNPFHTSPLFRAFVRSFFQQEGNPFHTSPLLRAFVRSFFQQEGNPFHTSSLLRAFVRSFFQQEGNPFHTSPLLRAFVRSLYLPFSHHDSRRCTTCCAQSLGTSLQPG